MELNINSPAYFANEYGIDENVNKYCQKLYKYFKDKKYSNTLSIIGIVPIVAPKELYDKGEWKEKIQIISNGECAIISIRMDFDSYYNANSDEKINMTKELILKAIGKIKSRVNFDYNKFCADLNSII